MNTYNENLQSTVISSLQAQGLDQRTVQSKMNASMFTLYYAEGATITASEKLVIAGLDAVTAAIVKAAAVGNTNLSNNLLSSATQGNQYASQSISNTAVAAANVQVAANAVVKLASDVGGIFSIVSSADFGTEIFTQAKEARHLMDNTAYSAELASELAMEASIGASAVSASTVLDLAKSTNGQMKNLLKVLSTDFNNAAQLVATDNAALSTKSAAEKVAEGDFEDLSVDYKASTTAYKSLNRGLNLGLRIPAKDISATGFTVKFRAIKSPFERDKTVAYYPVQNYYLLVVKESKQFTFSISQAEYILMNQTRRMVPVTLPQPTTGGEQPQAGTSAQPTQPAVNRIITVPVDIDSFSDNNGDYVLQDSDGDAITTGTSYVVYVMAVYVDEYKRRINVFDDFLSAPSQFFTLTNKLNAAQDISIGEPAQDNTITVTFTTNDDPDYKVQYRCILLLQNALPGMGMLTQQSINSINADIQSLEEIAEQYEPQIEDKQAQLSQVQQQQVTGNTANAGTDENTLKNDLNDLITKCNAATDSVANANVVVSKIGFVFNIDIAEQVPAANYLLPTQSADQPTGAGNAYAAKGAANANAGDQPSNPTLSWQVTIDSSATDNFGNVLLPGSQYIPVVLTISAEEEVNLPRFTNAMTDFENSPNFTYPSQPTNTNN